MKKALIAFAATLAFVQAAWAAGVSGDWKVTGMANNYPINITCTLMEAKGNTLTGSCKGQNIPTSLPIKGTHDGKSVTWAYDISYQNMPLHIVYDGQLKSATEIAGNIEVMGGPAGQFTAKKQ